MIHKWYVVLWPARSFGRDGQYVIAVLVVEDNTHLLVS